MLPVLVFLVSFGQFYKIVDSNSVADNAIDDNSFTYAEFPYRKSPNIDNLFFAKQIDNFPLFKVDPDKTLVKFQRPFTSVNIDFDRNALLSKFRKEDELFDFNEKLSSPEKRQHEHMPVKYNQEEEDDQRRNERSTSGARDPRGDNFMRFGRNPHEDFMRFGRAQHDDFMRLGRAPNEDFMRFGRDRGADYFRLGRSLRVRRDPGSNFMRLGRSSSVRGGSDREIADNFMRFGRSVTWPKRVDHHIENSLKLPRSDAERIFNNEPTKSLKPKPKQDENMPKNTGNAY